MRFLPLIALLCVGCGAMRPEAPPEAPQETTLINPIQVVNSCNTPVVRIESLKDGVSSCGNATVVRRNGLYVVTAWHIISDGGALTLWDGDKRIVCELGTPRHKEDVAVIPVTGRLEAFDVGGDIGIGSAVTVEGWLGKKRVTMSGEVTDVSVTSSVPVEFGMSGAPLMCGGKVVGVTTSIVNKTTNGRTTSGGNHVLLKFIKLFD